MSWEAIIDQMKEWVLEWITPYKVSGDINPDVTCTYFKGGTYNGMPYYKHSNGPYFIWWNGTDSWIISGPPVGEGATLWTKASQPVFGDYTPFGSSTGTATVAEGRKLLCTSYVDRGDPASSDFVISDFTRDSAWHELDLSSITPAGPSAALIRFLVLPPAINMTIELRERGSANAVAMAVLRTTVGMVWHDAPLIVGLDSTRIIEYKITAGAWSFIFATVNGWWL